jgi:GGDEF domain-containing protein
VPLLAELHARDLIAQLRGLSSVDPLTGCATRQIGLQRLRAGSRAHRASRELSVLLIDLDYFKSINDRSDTRVAYGAGPCGASLAHTLR